MQSAQVEYSNISCESFSISELKEIKNSLYEIKNSLELLKKDFQYFDKHLKMIDGRLWQIILLLLGYPLGLIVGKLTHIF